MPQVDSFANKEG